MNAEHTQLLKSLKRQQKASYVISFILHGLLFLGLFYIKVDWNVTIPEFIEIQFERGEAKQPEMPVAAPSEPVSNQQPEQLDLPERRMLEPETETLQVNDDAKVVPDEQMKIVSRDISDIHDQIPANRPINLGEKQVAEFDNNVKLSPDMTTEIGDVAVEMPFQIEGQAALRTILMKTLPRYPENLQQEAVVKIRFTVLPSGVIGEMIPVLKGSDELEKITMEAFKQWRFNPLAPTVPQLAEQGTITFRYILR
ncbi:TonB family protein [candidate division KSB1 bacterium]|nr:TonB family protein [candidate division KSB1 bacterium]